MTLPTSDSQPMERISTVDDGYVVSCQFFFFFFFFFYGNNASWSPFRNPKFCYPHLFIYFLTAGNGNIFGPVNEQSAPF